MVVLYDLYFVFVLFLNNFFLLKDGSTALHRAACFEQIVKILVKHGSNVHIQTIVFIFFFLFHFDFYFVFVLF